MPDFELIEIRVVPVEDVRPHPRNPRTITAERLAALKRDLSADPNMLTIRPLLATVDGTVVGGNMRLRAAQELGWESIPVAFAEMTEEVAAQRAIRDNVPYGEWDDSLLAAQVRWLHDTAGPEAVILTGLPTPDVDRLTGLMAIPEEENPLPVPPSKPKSRPGRVYELGPHRLMCGDSTNPAHIAKLMNGEKTCLVFTSPPYALGLDYASYEDTLPNLEKLLHALASEWKEHVEPGGYCTVNFGDVIGGADLADSKDPTAFPMALVHWPIFRQYGWVLNGNRVWIKPHGRVAAPWTATTNRNAGDWEHLWTWRKPGKSRVAGRRNPSYRGWWDTSKGDGVDVGKEIHPAGFPTILPRWVFKVYSDRGDIVVDPFAGSGSALIAAEQMGRRCYAMELDPGYCDLVRERWKQFQRQPKPIRGDQPDEAAA